MAEWPKHSDGRNKEVGDMTADEKRPSSRRRLNECASLRTWLCKRRSRTSSTAA